MKAASYYRFQMGGFECVCLGDGGHAYTVESFFANVPIVQAEEALRQRNLPTDHIWTPYTYLFVNTGKHRVLVDMGAGSLLETTGRLLPNMEAAGIEPAAIDSVVITHAHPDHIGGMLDSSQNLVYANARYFIWEEEWQFWFSESAAEKANEWFATFAREHLQPVTDRVTLVSDESDILPGVRVLAAPGHTPGHMVVSFSSADEQLLYLGDTVLHPLHLEHPHWLPVYDILPEKAVASKRRILDYAADQRAWVIGQHFPPFPSLGHIVRQGAAWRWQPVQIKE
jgi:glyoxylase-like metal-dependent hydrolase (beta-lactamase superfamily II)